MTSALDDQFVGTKWIFPHAIHDDSWHVTILRQHLTHSIGAFFGDMLEELNASFEEAIPCGEKDSGVYPSHTYAVRV